MLQLLLYGFKIIHFKVTYDFNLYLHTKIFTSSCTFTKITRNYVQATLPCNFLTVLLRPPSFGKLNLVISQTHFLRIFHSNLLCSGSNKPSRNVNQVALTSIISSLASTSKLGTSKCNKYNTNFIRKPAIDFAIRQCKAE